MIRRRKTTRPGERGAVLVEFTMVATLLLSIVIAVFEIGMMWSAHQLVTQSARSGARVGSQLGTLGETDREILRSIEAGFGSFDGDVIRVVVYESEADGSMPTACESASAGYSGTAHCNVYDATSLANLGSSGLWGSGSSCGTADANWCAATDRSDDQLGASYLGVYVQVEREFLTGFFGGGTHTISETTVMRIEPRT